jgi:general secretion pathway protein G
MFTFAYKSTRRGFTLIELLLVMVILAVLAAIVVPKFAAHRQHADTTKATTDISTLETALDAFQVNTGRYPASEEGLSALVTAPSNVTGWEGPYIKAVPMDPWGHQYIYRSPGEHNASGFDLSSSGPDGQEGTADDITNWGTGK